MNFDYDEMVKAIEDWKVKRDEGEPVPEDPWTRYRKRRELLKQIRRVSP